jgi:hypothetical protein
VGLVLLGYLIGRWQDSPTPASATPSIKPAESVLPVESSAPPEPTVYPTLQAETAERTGVEAQDTEDEGGGQNIGWIANGDSMKFDSFDFGPVPATKVDVRLASDRGDGGRMEIRLDSPTGPLAGTLNVTGTGGWQTWRTDEVTLTPVTGAHAVFLIFVKGDGGDFLNLNWLLFAH